MNVPHNPVSVPAHGTAGLSPVPAGGVGLYRLAGLPLPFGGLVLAFFLAMGKASMNDHAPG